MWNLFYRNFRLLILTISLILVWGLSSYHILPRMEDPELSQPAAHITTRFPGASAYRVESLVTEKIERQLLEIEEIETLESTSRPGISTVIVKLKDEIANKDRVWSKVRDKLSDVTPQLPQGALEPEYQDEETRASTLIAALTWNLEPPANYAILGRIAEELEDELRTLTGTDKVELFGNPDEEIVVEISPADLAMMGLTPQELSQQIHLSDAKVAAGQLRSTSNNLLIELETELDSLERIRQIPIRFASHSGQFARLGDIALVKKGIKEPPSDIAIIDGRPAVALAVLMESSQRIDQWAETTRQTLEEFRTRLPGGVDLQLIFDQSHYVENRLNGLFENLLLGALCVMGSTFFLMGWRSALVVGSSLPLSILMVFGGMRVLGIPLHQISVTGLVIALGLIIDNAIVVVDEVQQELQRGIEPKEAISKSVRYLAIPLLASTLTTVLTFMPIALLPGPTGEFVRTLALSVILALFSSLLLSLTVIPALSGRMHQISAGEQEKSKLTKAEGRGQEGAPRFKCWSFFSLKGEATIIRGKKKVPLSLLPSKGKILVKSQKSKGGFFPIPYPQSPIQNRRGGWWNTGFSQPGLTLVYRRTLNGILAQPLLGVLLALILPIIGFLMALSLDTQLFPPAERDQFKIEFELQSQASLEQTRSQVLQASEIILHHPEVVNVHWFVGKNAPKFYYNLSSSRQDSPNYAEGLVQLKSTSKSREAIRALQGELDQAFPSARVLVKQLEQGKPISAPIELRLYGSNLELLQELGNQIQAELAQVVNVTHTRAQLTETLPKLGLQVDEEQARLAGLNNTSIAQQLDANLEGAQGGSVLESTEELPVRVRLSNNRRGNLNQITSLDLISETAAAGENSHSVPLSTLSKIDLIPELATIIRRNGKRVNIIQGFITAGSLPSMVLANFKERLQTRDFDLPPGYFFEFGGEAAEQNKAVGNLMSTVGILLVLMIAILILSFGSFRSAGIVALVGLGSIGLGLASLWTSGYSLSFMAILGTVSLVGVAINDSIVVLTALRSHSAARNGNRQAIGEVVVRSTRHVLTTTVTTVVGFVPLLLDGGEFWPPLAVCIAGGVGGATLLALYFVPCTYLLLLSGRRRDRLRAKIFLKKKERIG